MKICLERRGFFTFRGVESFELDLLGKTVYERMRERLQPEEDDGTGDKIVLDAVYPFVTRAELFAFADGREGSYRFAGGAVLRSGCALSSRVRSQTPGEALFSLADYAAARARMVREIARAFANAGALVEEGALVEDTVRLCAGAVVRSGARVRGESFVGEDAEIGAGSELYDSFVGAGTMVRASVLDRARVGAHCTVGPFAYLRPGTSVGDGCRVGDFVELKNVSVGDGCKISHLAYVGDALLGRRVNVGCGAVFVNYDGRKKSSTRVGDGCFIGSNCNLVAPLEIGNGAFIAAGTTLTRDLADGDFCIGRSRETVKPGRGRAYFDPPE